MKTFHIKKKRNEDTHYSRYGHPVLTFILPHGVLLLFHSLCMSMFVLLPDKRISTLAFTLPNLAGLWK